jgi:uncharacterized protein (DUF58 family)
MPTHAKVRAKFQTGPGGALYTIITLLILAVAIYGQTNLLFWAFGLMVGGLLVSATLSWLMMRGMEVQRLLPTHGVAGEAMALRYQITNHNQWMPAFGLVICETWGKGSRGWRRSGPVAENPPRLGGRPHGWVLHVGPNQSVLADAPCWPLRRGLLTLQRVAVSSSFPFGVLRRVIEFERPASVLVYPQLFRMNRRSLHRLTQAIATGRKNVDRAGGNEEFFGLRDYRPGDSLKSVDWKRTARTGDLITREMTQTSPPRIVVALDLTGLPSAETPTGAARRSFAFWGRSAAKPPASHALADAERALSLTASLLCDAHFNGFQIGLMVHGVPCMTFPPNHSLPHRNKMLETLAMLDLATRVANPPPLPMAPSVVIQPGSGGIGAGVPAPRSAAGQMLLRTDQFEQYVTQVEGGSSAILNARSGPMTRREQLHRREGA